MSEVILQPIDTAPTDRKICLYHQDWESFPIAFWDWIEGPDENGNGGFCLWHIVEYNFPSSSGDGLLWPEEDIMPTHWFEIPKIG